MDKAIDAAQSNAIAQQVKARDPFNLTYQAALLLPEADYVQGFLAVRGEMQPREHAWLELGESIVDPSLPKLRQPPESLAYIPAHRLDLEALQGAIEEAKEDYPEDDPLPIYGGAPESYDYYGDVMLGDRAYSEAFEAAKQVCRKFNAPTRKQP
jgi:hypothetical protein